MRDRKPNLYQLQRKGQCLGADLPSVMELHSPAQLSLMEPHNDPAGAPSSLLAAVPF